MNEIETAVQKNIIALKNYLRKYSLAREEIKQLVNDLVKVLIIQSEEFVSIERVQSKTLCIDNFNELTEKLLQVVLGEFELTLYEIHNKMTKLKQFSNDMKNYIDKLEESSMHLEWQSPSICKNGNENQPPLKELLKDCLEYRNFLTENTETAHLMLNNIDVRKRNSLDDFQNFFHFKFSSPIEGNLIAMTEFIE